MRHWKMVFVTLWSIFLLAGCGPKYVALPINEDVDVCVICNMQVKDDAYATQLTTKDGQTYKFDDIGCMNEWKEKNGTEQIGMDFVRDYNDKEWIEFNKATYVYDASIRTPMAYGLVSFKDKESAENFIQEQGVGVIMTAADLTSHDWKQNTEGMDMMGEGGHSHEHEQGDSETHGSENKHGETGHH
ncbi:nitrous oxide reductase accessory protein NosL [Paenibacillus illinoisensis]|uniref:Lipoprotein n=1 Tax=Paenibacillus illinoisensis TaxID=59845 RepID=A0A2W0C9H6_9BACL|nr:nitrous oxide reductase accessory protein NosL [Paenibacillus illinoisensis]PYY29653.1 Uncharacterized protein PIL02S_01853 [Paenibacillus illinoisensis]